MRLVTGCEGTAPAAPSDAVIWRDHSGVNVASGFTIGADHWIRVPGVGDFRFREGSEEVRSLREPGVPAATVVDTYRRAIFPIVLQALGCEVLHASAVRMDGCVVALCAASGTGKSTLAYALSRRGHAPFADDAVACELAGEQPRARTLPFEVHLRPDAAAFFDVSGSVPSEEPAGESAPLAALCVLERAHPSAAGGPVRVRSLSPAAAFPTILKHAYCFSLEPVERRRSMLERYLELVERVPTFEVRLWPGLDNLEQVTTAIEGVARPPASMRGSARGAVSAAGAASTQPRNS